MSGGFFLLTVRGANVSVLVLCPYLKLTRISDSRQTRASLNSWARLVLVAPTAECFHWKVGFHGLNLLQSVFNLTENVLAKRGFGCLQRLTCLPLLPAPGACWMQDSGMRFVKLMFSRLGKFWTRWINSLFCKWNGKKKKIKLKGRCQGSNQSCWWGSSSSHFIIEFQEIKDVFIFLNTGSAALAEKIKSLLKGMSQTWFFF